LGIQKKYRRCREKPPRKKHLLILNESPIILDRDYYITILADNIGLLLTALPKLLIALPSNISRKRLLFMHCTNVITIVTDIEEEEEERKHKNFDLESSF